MALHLFIPNVLLQHESLYDAYHDVITLVLTIYNAALISVLCLLVDA